MRPAEVDHRLDGEDHARPHLDALAAVAVVKDVGRVVEELADAVTAEVTHDGASFGFGIGLYRSADRAGPGAGPYGSNAAHKAFICHFEQPLGGALDLPHRVHAAGIPMPAIEDVGDVDVDDVSLLQWLVIRNTMANDM